MDLNEPAEVTAPEDFRRKVEEQEAVTRGTLWEQMGCPQSKLHMPIDEYMKSFRGRHWFANKTVLTQAQLTLRIVLCPKCYETIDTKAYLGIRATQFFTTIEDDVMTVFPAVGHFVCHWCGFEEWHPLRHDPRVKTDMGVMGQQAAMQRPHQHISMQGIGSAIGGPMFGSAGMNQLGQGLSQQQANLQAIQDAYVAGAIGMPEAAKAAAKIMEGIQPGMGPIWGMTEDEKRSLHRLYQQTKGATCPPPKIVESKEEAELLLKLAPVERRQAIIQKLRDLGKI